MVTGLMDSVVRTAFFATLDNWCLDDGTTDHINYSVWAGKTTDKPLTV